MSFPGICYQINGNGTFATEDAGLANGLSFSLNVYPKEYYIGYFAQSTGMSVRELIIPPLIQILNVLLNFSNVFINFASLMVYITCETSLVRRLLNNDKET